MSSKPQSRHVNFALLLSAHLSIPFFLLWLSEKFNQVMPMNDVLLYGWWLQLMQQGQPLMGVAQPYVYPYPSILPMWLAQLLGGGAGILVGWCLLVAALNLIAVGYLTDWGRGSRATFAAAWFWAIFLLLLGPVSIGRIDAIAASLTVIGVVFFARGNLIAAASLFTFGAWIKIWPAALTVATFISDKSKRLVAYAVAAVVSLVFLVAFFLGGNSNVLSFVYTQGNRGIQIESVVATPWLWAAKFGFAHASIYYDKEIITNQIAGDWVALVSSPMTPVMIAALIITVWLGYRGLRAGADRNKLFVIISMTAVLDLIVFNKVGSPQFMSWLAVPVIAWLYFELRSGFRVATSFAIVALVTNLVYPVFYMDLMGLGDTSLWLLTLRNCLLIVLLIFANLQLSALGKTKNQATI